MSNDGHQLVWSRSRVAQRRAEPAGAPVARVPFPRVTFPLVAIVLVPLLLAACGGPARSNEARIESFEAAPAEVAIGEPVTFRWEVAPGTPDAVCRLDADGDGADDYRLQECREEGSSGASRLHVFDAAGAFTARLALDAGGSTEAATAEVRVLDPDRENAPPTLGEMPDRVVIRNLVSPRTLAVEVPADDADGDPLTVTYASSDEAVIPSGATSCTISSCVLELEPSPDRTAQTTLDVTVADGRGGSASTSFTVRIRPRRVTSTSDAGDGSLRAAVAASADGDVIGFDEDGLFADPQEIVLDAEIVVDVDVYLEGTGMDRLTLSGGRAVRVLRVAGATVTLEDLTVADGNAHDDAALPNEETAASVGGGIFNDGTLTLRRVRIARNAAQLGGGIYNHHGVLRLEASLVGGPDPADGNTAAEGALGSGGGIYNDEGTLRLRDTAVRNNTTVGDGGGIASRRGMIDIEGGEVAANVADTDGNGHGDGGGIATAGGDVTIWGTTIGGAPEDGNRAADGGGVANHGGAVSIAASTVAGNRADSGPGSGRGGALVSDGPEATVVIREGTVLDANSAGSGGAIANVGGGSVAIAGSALVGNAAPGEFGTGGGIYNDRFGTLSIRDSSLRGNSAGDNGGAIASRGVVTLDATVVGGPQPEDANTAGTGGAVYSRESAFDDTVQVTIMGGSRIEGNVALGSGGGVFHIGDTLTILQSVVTGNAAGASGGGLWAARDVLLDHAELSSNRAEGSEPGQGGGGVYHAGPLAILASDVRDNTATAAGGAILTSGGILSVGPGSTLAGNAARDGGAVHLRVGAVGDRPQATLDGATLASNRATDAGGAIWNRGGAVELLDVTATGNEAHNGGVLFQEVPPEVDPGLVTARISGSLLTGNAATRRAGAVYIHRAVLTVENGTRLRANTAGEDGGAIYNGLGDVTVVGSVIGGPDAADANTGGFGGGVFNNRGTFACGADAEITGNVARDEGGGIYDLFGDETSHLEGCTAGSGGNVFGNDPDDIAP